MQLVPNRFTWRDLTSVGNVRRDLRSVRAGGTVLDGRVISVKPSATKDPIHGGHGGQALGIAGSLPGQLLPDLPGEHRRLFLLHS